jgi:carboxymethylenebutenolidase
MKLVLCLLVMSALALQDPAKERLEKSPRHLEWITVKHGERTVHAFIAYPEVKEKAPVVVIIHEIFGLTDWVRSVADQLAERGCIAIAPDFLSGMGPKGGKTSDFEGGDAVRAAIQKLPPDQITADLNAVCDFGKKDPACNGKVAVGGFCWGGLQTFRFATNRADLAAGYVFYGRGPESAEEIARITCPIYGFYAVNDARVNATLPKIEDWMKAGKKTFEPKLYDGGGHGFMRAGEMNPKDEGNAKARADAWKRWDTLLKELKR